MQGPVVQLVRMPACHAGGRGFESRPDRHFNKGSVAQLVEQRTENPCVGGSIPSRATLKSASVFKQMRFLLAEINEIKMLKE